MKKMLFSTLLSVLLGSNAFAANKVCFGSTKDDDTKGLVILVQVDAQNVSIKTIKAPYYDVNDYYNGTYPAYNSDVNARDGKRYLAYRGENSDYQDVILVDEALLQDSTSGLLQIRARGEGYFNAVYFCKDAAK